MNELKFVVRFRNHQMTLCTLTLPCELYTPEQCEAEVENLRRAGYRIDSAGTEWE